MLCFVYFTAATIYHSLTEGCIRALALSLANANEYPELNTIHLY